MKNAVSDALSRLDSYAPANLGGESIQAAGAWVNEPSDAIIRAQFNLTATRDTINIAATPLPYALFGHNDLQSAYQARNVLEPVAGGTLVVTAGINAAAADQTRVNFAWTVGANTDNISITCTEYPYPSLVQALSTKLFRIDLIRMTLSDPTQLTQFNQALRPFMSGFAGATTGDAITPTAGKGPNQFQDGIIDVPYVLDIDAYSGIGTQLIAVAAFSITYSIYASMSKTWNRRQM